MDAILAGFCIKFLDFITLPFRFFLIGIDPITGLVIVAIIFIATLIWLAKK